MLITRYTVLLLVTWVGPSTLTLSRYTYSLTSIGHFVSFLISVVLFVLMGRSLKKRRHQHRFFTGLFVGSFVGALGTGISETIRHLPPAARAFSQYVPQVPTQAAFTMLTLHAIPSALLAAAMFAVLFGGLGAIATWWGGVTKRTAFPGPKNPKPNP